MARRERRFEGEMGERERIPASGGEELYCWSSVRSRFVGVREEVEVEGDERLLLLLLLLDMRAGSWWSLWLWLR